MTDITIPEEAEEAQPDPVQVFSLSEILADEMIARGWTASDVANRMSDRKQYGIRYLAFQLLLAVQNEKIIIDDETFSELARVFEVSEQFFRNVHLEWTKWPDRRAAWECPEELLT